MVNRSPLLRASLWVGAGILVGVPNVYGIDDFPGYTSATNDLYTTWNNAGGTVARNASPSFVGSGLDFSGIGYGVLSELFSRAYISPIHVASANHTTALQSNFWVAPNAGGTPIKMSSGTATQLAGNGVFLATGYDTSVAAMSGAHIAPSYGVTTYAILDLASAQDYDERSVIEVGHGDSNPELSPRVAVTTINSVSGTTITTRRPAAPLQGGDSGGPTFTAWTNPLGAQELVFLATHSTSDQSGSPTALNGSNFFGNTTTINAANAVMINQGFAIRLAGVAATTWTGNTSSNFATGGNWSSSAPASTNYVAFNGATVAQRAISLGAATQSLRGLQFGAGNSGQGFTFSNGTLQIGRGGIVNYSSASQTFNSNVAVTLSDHQYWDAVNANLNIAGSVNLNGKLLVVQGNHDTTISGVINDSNATSVGLTKYGTGDLVLGQAATYAGKTWIYGGTLRFEGSGALPAATPLALANNNTARLELGGQALTVSSLNSVIGQADDQGTIDLGVAGALTLDQPTNVDAAFSGAIAGGSSGGTSMVLRGPTGSNIEFTLGGPSTFAGQTRIERGNVHINHVNALGAGGAGNETIIVADDSNGGVEPSVRLRGEGTMNETVVLLNSSATAGTTASHSLLLTSPNLTLTAPIILARAANDSTRATSWNLQTVNSVGVVADVHFGDITGRLEAGSPVGASSLTLHLYQNSQYTMDGVISNGTLGTGLTLTTRGDGTVRFNEANSYTGLTSLRAKNNIVQVNALSGQAGAFGNATTAVTVGADDSLVWAAGLYAANGVEIGRNLTISSSNTTGVKVGALDDSTALYSGTVALSRASTSLYAGTNSVVTFSNNITTGTGTPMVVKQGDGTVILSGTNSYTGGTTVEAGRLRAKSAQALGTTGTVQVTGGVLEIDAGVSLANSNLQVSGGRLEVNGSINGLGFQSGTLAGKGTVNAALALDSAVKTITPGQGNTPGALAINGNQTWSAFTYDWQVNDLATSADPAASADRLNINGTLNLGGSYELQIFSLTQANELGLVPNGDGDEVREWTVLTASGGIEGFDASQWMLDRSQFSHGESTPGSFALYQDGNALILSFNPVPEPSAIILAGGGMLFALRRRRRRHSVL